MFIILHLKWWLGDLIVLMDHQLRQIAVDNIDLLLECGFNKPGSTVELCDRVDIIQTVTLHKVVLASLAELSQFRDGINALGVAESLKNNPDLLYSFYCCEHNDELSSGTSSIYMHLYCCLFIPFVASRCYPKTVHFNKLFRQRNK